MCKGPKLQSEPLYLYSCIASPQPRFKLLSAESLNSRCKKVSMSPVSPIFTDFTQNRHFFFAFFHTLVVDILFITIITVVFSRFLTFFRFHLWLELHQPTLWDAVRRLTTWSWPPVCRSSLPETTSQTGTIIRYSKDSESKRVQYLSHVCFYTQ